MSLRPIAFLPVYHSCGFAGLVSVQLPDGSWSENLCSYCDRDEVRRLRTREAQQ